jgi:signal transduction histidine kinase
MEQTGGLADSLLVRRLLAAFRAAIAMACLLVQLAPPVASHWGVTTAAFLFAAYALVSLLARWEERPGFELLGLIVQTIFFLVFSAFGNGSGILLGGALYCHLMLSCLLTQSFWNTCIVSAASNGFLAVVHTEQTAALWPVAAWLSVLAAAGALQRSRIERLLTDSARHVGEWREQAERARDAERQKLAGDFHDGPLQGFAALQMRLETLRKIMERKPEAAMEELRSVQELSRGQTAEMRAFLRGIRPVEVGEAGLVSSLRQSVTEFQKHSGIGASFQSQGSPDPGSAARSAELVQIVQEALNNVRKHSKATRVAVTIDGSANQIEITVEDNGAGFPFSGAYSLEELDLLRLGPASIRTRVRSLGGKLTLESRPQRGASISVQIPA